MTSPLGDMMQLALASWETIFHRTVMMTNGTCSQAEYDSMIAEKLAASQLSLLALATGQSQEAVMAPYLAAATANAKRLRER
jgi:hypothetical protein